MRVMTHSSGSLQQIIEAALLVAGRPLTPAQLQKLFEDNEKSEKPELSAIQAALRAIAKQFENTGIVLQQVASGWQLQSRPEWAPWLSRLWEERPPRYSRALLETLSLIAWRQPVTRAEIESIRGVTVSPGIVRTLQEREWIRVVGQRDLPGKPSLYGTTKTFLDDFGLKSLSDLPELPDMPSESEESEKTEKIQRQADLLQARLPADATVSLAEIQQAAGDDSAGMPDNTEVDISSPVPQPSETEEYFPPE